MAFREELAEAFASSSFPCNPRPFAHGLAELCADRGSDAIQSDDAKKVLWVLMSMAYGQLATIDLSAEWDRLYKGLTEEQKLRIK